MTRFAMLAAGLVAVFGLVTLAPHAASAQQATLRIVLEITDQGYRCAEGCDAVDFTAGDWYPGIDVPLGAEVELVFVWAHEAYPFEEHVMLLDGYRLETEQIDADNREATLRFIADQPGTQRLKCDLHCDLHDYMQRAELRVQPSGNGMAGAPAYTPTTLALHSAVPVITGLEPVALDARLTDDGGEPIARAELLFYVEAEFGGVEDLVRIGTARTDELGAATYRFLPLTPDPEQRVVARFAGMGVYDGSEEELRLRVTGARPRSVFEPQASRFEHLAGPFGARSLALVVLAVWGSFAFVLFQVFRIARDRSER